MPKKASLSVSSGTSYIIRLYPTSSGHYSFFTSPESTTTLTNTTIAVYSDSALTNVMAFDDNGGYSLNACVSVYLNAYTYYYFVLSAFSTTSSGVVTYNIMKGLPVSGSEIDYDPNMWNLTNLLGNTNCYAYALNCQTNPPGATHTFLQIGQSVLGMFGLDITHYTPDGSEVLYYVQQDSSNWGFYFSEISRTAMCSSGKYKVALVIDPYYDFHWYRQNPDGTWSHKPGPNTVRDYDYSTQTIYDPATANRDNGIDLNYEYVIGFYEVTPLNSNAFSIGLGEGFLTEEVEAIITQSSIKASSLSTLARFQDSSD